MNGRERAVRQIRAGVRDLVTEIDGLKMALGFSNVDMQTTRAEITLRKGERARIPVVLTCTLPEDGLEVTFSFPTPYPDEPFEVQNIAYSPERIYDEEHRARIHELCSNLEYRIEQDINSSLDFINYVRNIPNFSQAINEWGLPQPDAESAEETGPRAIESEEQQKLECRGCDMDDNAAEDSCYRSFSCRMCRAHLFTDLDLDLHKRDKSCLTLFLSNPKQSSSAASEQGGKIACPACKAKLGAWSWLGTQCSCE